ncbi:hypothetical protein ABPG77_011515 [Micractinium sp. CCAP 211/92]
MASTGSIAEEEVEEVPEEFMDPISFACMEDPVLLCGTGQVYCLRSLRAWLQTGSRTCPKTNMAMRDVEVVRLPSLRSRIASWRAQHGLEPLPPLDPAPAEVQAAGPWVARLLLDLRCGDAYNRGLAAGVLNDLLITWGPQPTPAQVAIMEAVLLDLVWLLRQGDPFGSGVAAAALSQYERPEQVAFLAAVAAMPAVALLWSPHSYGQHSAARLLSNLARAFPAMPDVLVEAGAVRGLLQQLDLRQPFPYSRCSAAAALAALCASDTGRDEVRAGGGVALLKALVLQSEATASATAEPGAGTELLVRFDKRDAAGCLLALDISPEEAAAEPAVERRTLLALHHCSHAWLKGEVAEPGQGYSEQELAAGLNRLALGVVHEADEAAEAGGEAAEQPQAARAEAGEGAGAGAGAGGGDIGREGGQAA